MLPEFELLRPRTLPEVLTLLSAHAPHAMPVAGGTNVIVDLRHSGMSPEPQRANGHSRVLVDLSRVAELRGIRRSDGYIACGAGTTIAELLEDPLIARHGALFAAAALFANPLVRNRATLGGNLADASPAADTAVPLLALDAEVELASVRGARWVRLAQFLPAPVPAAQAQVQVVGVQVTLRQPDELLTAIRWPVPAERSRGAYHKLGLRKADAISVLSAAVLIGRNGAGDCLSAAIALGAVAPHPFRAVEAEAALAGRPLSDGLIAEAARLAAAAACPISDIRGSAAYRRRVTEVVVRRLLIEAAGLPVAVGLGEQA